MADDFCQQAMLQILSYPDDLRIGPEPVEEPTSAWYDRVEKALRGFARSPSIIGSVFRIVYSGVHPGKIEDDNLQKIPDLEDIPDPDSEPRFIEGQHWSQIYLSLRKFLLELPDIDPLELEVIDALHWNAVRDSCDPGAEEFFRGDTFQIIHQPLLTTLCEKFPESEWNIVKLRVTLAKVCRHAQGIQKDI